MLAFLLSVLVGGGASVAIRISYAELASFWASTARFIRAALAYWSLVYFRKIPFPQGRALLGAGPAALRRTCISAI